MFGCSHLRCHCGAHWCWHCQRSTNECEGDCGEGDDSDEEVEDDLDDDVSDIEAVEELQVATQRVDTTNVSSVNNTQDSGAVSQIPRNLDAGGSRRWADGDEYFGDDPDEDNMRQIWSCQHAFIPFQRKDDDFNHGDLASMECNRCFKHVEPPQQRIPTPPSPKKKPKRRKLDFSASKGRVDGNGNGESPAPAVNSALECASCYLLVCEKCRDRYEAEEDG